MHARSAPEITLAGWPSDQTHLAVLTLVYDFGGPMFIGAAILYFVLLITLGVMCLRKGHWVMFILGIFLPLFWLIGAVIAPVQPAT